MRSVGQGLSAAGGKLLLAAPSTNGKSAPAYRIFTHSQADPESGHRLTYLRPLKMADFNQAAFEVSDRESRRLFMEPHMAATADRCRIVLSLPLPWPSHQQVRR